MRRHYLHVIVAASTEALDAHIADRHVSAQKNISLATSISQTTTGNKKANKAVVATANAAPHLYVLRKK
jgi:hypothetical protein